MAALDWFITNCPDQTMTTQAAQDASPDTFYLPTTDRGGTFLPTNSSHLLYPMIESLYRL